MKIIKAEYKIINPFEHHMSLREYMDCMVEHIEVVARTCYKSEDKITQGSYKDFVRRIIDRGHEAMIEHSSFSVRFIVDRGVSHELVRHRIASFAQESTRYCNYSKDKFGNELTFIEPYFWSKDAVEENRYLDFLRCQWENTMRRAQETYLELIKDGATPQEARSVLPNSIKTEVVMTTNFREWRTFFKLRTSNAAHPQMQEVARPLLKELQYFCPVIFDDITF